MDLRQLRYFVAVADERHVGRAAERLKMSQPPLSRAIQQLERELGTSLLTRLPTGVELTAAGVVLHLEAQALLEHADQVRVRVMATSGVATITVGTLADSASEIGTKVAQAFRTHHPDVDVRVRESDLADPTCGLRAGLVDVAVTRLPFDTTGLGTQLLRSDQVAVLVRSDDALAGQARVRLADLQDRTWFRMSDEIDATWAAFWSGGLDEAPVGRPEAHPIVVRTIQECIHAVLWNGVVGLSPMGTRRDDRVSGANGLTMVPVSDMAPSRLVVAWRSDEPNPLVRTFIEIAFATLRSRQPGVRGR